MENSVLELWVQGSNFFSFLIFDQTGRSYYAKHLVLIYQAAKQKLVFLYLDLYLTDKTFNKVCF